MQFKLIHLLVAIAIIAVTLAISPALTFLLGLFAILFVVINPIVSQRRGSENHTNDLDERKLLPISLGLLFCVLLFFCSVGLPIVQELIYQFSGRYLQLWLVPQLIFYIASLSLLSATRFDPDDRYECLVIVTIFHVVFVPLTMLAVFLWRYIGS